MLPDKEKNRINNTYGPWAVVTGATSGIGLALADCLADAGLHLVLVARNQQQLQLTSVNFQKKYGIKTIIQPADLSTPEGCQLVIHACRDLETGLFIGSAGYGTSGLFIHNDIENERDMLRVNCEGVLVLTHHFARYFAERQRGGIILLSSLVAFQGVPYSANYAATKAYVQSLAEALAVELKPYHVDVLAAAPGPVASGFGSRANMKMDFSLTPEQVAPPTLRALGRKSTVLPGFLSILLVNALRTVPRWAKVQIMKMIMGGMTKHQRVASRSRQQGNYRIS